MIRRKKIIITLLLSSTCLLGQTNVVSLNTKAAEAYQQKHYQQALSYYQDILKTGFVSGELYYNMGNASYQKHQLSRARWYYEKAMELIPDDISLRKNLTLLQQKLIDKEENDNVFDLVFDRWNNMFSLRVMIWANGLLLSLFTGLCVFNKLSSHSLFRVTLSVLFIMIALNITWWPRWQRVMTQRQAIIYPPRVAVKSGPDQNQSDVFILHEGAKVYLIDQKGEWVYIKFNRSLRGWIPDSSLMKY